MRPIIYLNPAKKFLKKLKEKPLKQKFYDSIQDIRLDPYLGDMKSGDLAGIFCLDIYYNGIHYELAYCIEYNDQDEIIVPF